MSNNCVEGWGMQARAAAVRAGAGPRAWASARGSPAVGVGAAPGAPPTPPAPAKVKSGRRCALGRAVAAAAALGAVRSPAARAEGRAPELVAFKEPAMGFQLDIPEGWPRGEAPFPGTPPGALWSWMSEEDPEVSVTVVVKPISVEFTKMGSFGDVDTWADNIIAAMDNSWQYERALKRAKVGGGRWEEPPEFSEARLLKAGLGPGGSYAAEYTVRAGGAPAARTKRVTVVSGLSLRTHVGDAPPPRASDSRRLPEGNLLFTATGSCPKERSAAFLPLLQRSVGSLRLPPPR